MLGRSVKRGQAALNVRRLAVLWGALAVMGSLATPAENGDLFGRAYGPRGLLKLKKPAFLWEVWSTEPGEIVGGAATIDEKSVDARYDAERKTILVDLKEPLTPGEHTIKLSAMLKDGEAVHKTWTVNVADDAVSALPVTSESQLKTLGIVNRFRAELGLELCTMDDRINAASLLHSKYLAANKTTGHHQAEDKPGYFGRTPIERLETFGFLEDSWEVVEFGALDEAESLQNLIDAPYHRLPFLQPGAPKFGSGWDTQRLSAIFSIPKTVGTVAYPFDGQMGVKTTWSKNERPNPLRIHKDVRFPVGYPVVFAHFGPGSPVLKVRLAQINDEKDVEVPCHLNTPDNDNELHNALFLIPKGPLKPNTTYFVRVEASVENGPDVSRIWRFTTGSR